MSWPLIKLGDIVKNCSSKRIPLKQADRAERNGDYRYYGASGVIDYVDDYLFDGDYLLIGEDGNNLLSRSTPIAFHANGKFWVNNHAHVLSSNGKADLGFISYYINSINLEAYITGSAQPKLNKSNLEAIKVPLPPLEEQKRIAAILDKADAIRRKRQQAINLADDFLRSVFLDMFGDPVTNPKGWEIKQVGKIVDCIVPGRDKPKSFTGGMPWITTNDLKHLGTTSESEKSMGLSDDEIATVKARVIPKNSVLMTCVGDLGVISIAGNDMVMNQQLHAFLPSENIEKEFLIYALSFQKHYMIKMASSTTVPYMNKTVCNSVPVILPPIEEQKRFSVLCKKSSLLRERLISTDSNKGALFNSLTQKAFAGEL